MNEGKNLNLKISGALGNFHKHHQSNVNIRAGQPMLVFSRPGRKGYFSIDTIPDRAPSAVYDAILDGQYLGRFNYAAIVEKFSIGRV
jgi:hypothetical protein